MEIKEYRLFSSDVKEILMFKWFKRDNGKDSCRHDFFGFCKLFTFFGSHVFFWKTGLGQFSVPKKLAHAS